MKHLRKFCTHTEYESYMGSEDKVLPNICLCEDEYNIHINKNVIPVIENCLKFTANTDNATVTLIKNGSPEEINIEYKINDNEWTDYTIGTGIQLPSTDDEVMFRNKSNTVTNFSISKFDYYNFDVTDGTVSVSGNINTLIKNDGNVNALPNTYCFCNLFISNANLTDASELLLPANTLTMYCYECMFKNCTALTSAPSLPAMVLANQCYDSMFQGCILLEAAPALPATILFTGCYQRMFDGCQALTITPELNATLLVPTCYYSMFSGCTSLLVAPELPGLALAEFCYASMFSGCTSLENAPVLPAPGLAVNCYNNMFNGCTNLNHIECYIENTNTECTLNWVENVAETGSFVKHSAAVWTRGVSGIPEGWLVTNK